LLTGMLCVVDRLMSQTADVNIQSSVGMFIFCGLLHSQFCTLTTMQYYA